MASAVKSGTPDQEIGPGFCISGPSLQAEENSMLRSEIAFAKQALTATRDWDTFQAVLRKCFSVKKPSTGQTGDRCNKKT